MELRRLMGSATSITTLFEAYPCPHSAADARTTTDSHTASASTNPSHSSSSHPHSPNSSNSRKYTPI
jgi:hypothetical protein